MKKLFAVLLLFSLLVSLCACRKSAEEPPVTLDIPNIDHNILDADRHLGNSFENYSSEDTLLVEYGNRIFHAYNSRHEIMEYCTENDKEKPLGIYGTNLSVYKNVLYYIGEDGTSIHAYDLATNTDSVWITGEEVATLLPAPTYQYPRISNLIVTDYGICMLYGSSSLYFIHLSFNKSLISTSFYPEITFKDHGSDFLDLIPISTDNLFVPYNVSVDRGVCIYNLSSAAFSYHSLSDTGSPVFFDGGKSAYLYSFSPIDTLDIMELNLLSFSTKPLRFFKDYTTRLFPVNKYKDFFYYNVLKEDFSSYRFIKKSLSDSSSHIICDEFAVTNLTFTSNNMVYGMTDNLDTQYISKFFRADLDFQNIIYLD